MKLVITVMPANMPELEYTISVDDEPTEDQLTAVAEAARAAWREQLLEELELSVSIEKEEWKQTGRFGTAEEDVDVSDIMRQAYNDRGFE